MTILYILLFVFMYGDFSNYYYLLFRKNKKEKANCAFNRMLSEKYRQSNRVSRKILDEMVSRFQKDSDQEFNIKSFLKTVREQKNKMSEEIDEFMSETHEPWKVVTGENFYSCTKRKWKGAKASEFLTIIVLFFLVKNIMLVAAIAALIYFASYERRNCLIEKKSFSLGSFLVYITYAIMAFMFPQHIFVIIGAFVLDIIRNIANAMVVYNMISFYGKDQLMQMEEKMLETADLEPVNEV